MMNFQRKLAIYADIILTVGLNIKTGDKILIKHDAQNLEFVRLLIKYAYQMGAADVQCK